MAVQNEPPAEATDDYLSPMRSLSSGCFFFLPRIERIGWIMSCGGRYRSKSLLLSPGLTPLQPDAYAQPCKRASLADHPHPSGLPTSRRKASNQNSCPWQYKISLFGGYGRLPQTCQEPVLTGQLLLSPPLPGGQYARGWERSLHQAKDIVVAPGEPIFYCQRQLFCFLGA